ncbi:hypothetical protein [Leeia oryzae]|uniref:hypothetical protein n=1 Tax=Leeia oryzae TaxID=356662 RepID=UPI00039BF9BF|nr:hypothetical protein [Leeia oryzae]
MNTPDTGPVAAFLTHIRPSFPSGTRLTWLQIGLDDTRVVTDHEAGTPVLYRLAVGTQQMGGRGFKQYPPTPYELEMAIAEVEDELMPLARQWHGVSTLVLADTLAQQVVLMSGEPVGDTGVCSRDAIESLFGQLAAVSQGRPVASSGLPAETDFAAYVLILREFMHHVGFESLTLR